MRRAARNKAVESNYVTLLSTFSPVPRGMILGERQQHPPRHLGELSAVGFTVEMRSRYPVVLIKKPLSFDVKNLVVLGQCRAQDCCPGHPAPF